MCASGVLGQPPKLWLERKEKKRHVGRSEGVQRRAAEKMEKKKVFMKVKAAIIETTLKTFTTLKICL